MSGKLGKTIYVKGEDTQIACAGDSIMAGTTAPNTISIAQAMAAYYGPLSLAVLTNDGVPGSRLDSTIGGGSASAADMVARYTENIFPKRPSITGSKKTILLIDIGANDFSVLTLAQIPNWITAFENYCAKAQADGFLIVAFTIMARNNNNDNVEGSEENRKRMNNAIRRSINIDGYVDAAQLLDPSINTTLFIDGTHPTDAGNKLLGRAATSAIEQIGKTIPTLALPASNGDPILSQATIAALDSVAIECAVAQVLNLNANIPAIGAGDYTVEFWVSQSASAVQGILDSSGGSSFGVYEAAQGGIEYLGAYVIPGTQSNWSTVRGHLGFWNHYLISRLGTVASFYLNGKLIGTASDTNTHTAITRMSFVPGKTARVRMYSRALTANQALENFNNLSEFNANESSYIYVIEDGHRCIPTFIEDLSPSGAHLGLIDSTKVKVRRPSRRGIVKFNTVESVVVTNIPTGYRATSYVINVLAAGGGTVDIGDTNGGGQFLASTAVAVGLKALTLTNSFTQSGAIFVNATGYTIAHTILLEKL